MPTTLPKPTVPFFDPRTQDVHVQWQNYLQSIVGAIPTDFPPVDARYVVTTSNGTLTNEINLGALSSGLLRAVVAAGIATISTIVFPGGTTDFLRGDGTFAPPAAGAGDVVGPASAVDDRVATFDGATGKLLQDGGMTIADILAAGGGGGDVVGPASAVDNSVAVFDTTTGKLIKDGGKTLAVVQSDAVTAAEASIIPINLATEVTGDLPYANLVQASAASRILGRGSAGGAGDWQEVTLGAGLAYTGTVLNTTGGGGGLSQAEVLARASLRA